MRAWLTLVRVELRKATDTRAARWLFATLAVLAIGSVLVARQSLSTLQEFLIAPALPLTALLPIVAILAMCGEWAQRTAVTTFTLVPRRSLVLSARIVAAVILVITTCSVVSCATTALFATLRPEELAQMSISAIASSFRPVFALALCAALTGIAVGSLLLNTPVAIVVTILLPVTYDVVMAMALPQIGPWISTLALSGWLSAPHLSWGGSGEVVGAGQALTSFLLWVALPTAIGFWRQLRKEAR